MSLATLAQLASKPTLDLTAYLTAAEQEPDMRGPREIVETLVFQKRYDLVEQLESHPVYGEDARQEMNIHRMLEQHAKEWAAKVAAYPPILLECERLLDRAPGIYHICYPSVQAQENGLGDDYVAVSGDGLFLYMFKVLSLDGRGVFRYEPHPKGSENQWSARFREANGIAFGDQLLGDQLLKALRNAFNVEE